MKEAENREWYMRLEPVIWDREAFLLKGKEVSLKKGETLLEAGKIPKYGYLIEEGLIFGAEYSPTSEKRVYNFDHFNSAGVLLFDAHMILDYPVSVSFKAFTDTRLRAFDRKLILEEAGKNPEIYKNILRSVSYKFVSAMEQVREQRSHTAKWKILHLLLVLSGSYGRKFQDGILLTRFFSQQEIADMLGINRITFARIISELKKAGTIRVIDGYYFIPSVDGLKHLLSEMV